MNIISRIANESDLSLIADLNLQHYGSDYFTNPDYFRWRFVNNNTPDSFMICAYNEKVLAGVTGMSVSSYLTKGSALKVAVSVSSLVRLDYRHTLIRTDEGFLTVLGLMLCEAEKELRNRQVSAVMAFPNENSLPQFVELLGYQHKGFLDFLFLPLHTGKLLKGNLHYGPSLLSIAGSIVDGTIWLLKPKPNRFSDIDLRPIKDLADLDTISSSAGSAFTLHRDQNFFQWRFSPPPTMPYRQIGAYKDGKLFAYLVWSTSETFINRAKRTSLRSAKLIDLQVPSNDPKIISTLIDFLIASAHSEGAAIIYSTIKCSSDMLQILSKSGLFAFRGKFFGKKIPLIGKALSPEFNLSEIDHCFITMADNDIV